MIVFSTEFAETAGPRNTRRLRSIVHAWVRTWQLPSVDTQVEIRPNLRLKTTVARYRRDKRTIEVGARFFALRSGQTEVLAHEMAHAVIDIRHGQAVAIHGHEWKALVRAVGFEPQTRLAVAGTRPLSSGSTRHSRYVHRCSVCQMVRMSSRPIRRWRCRSCVEAGLTGNLEITEAVLAK